MGRSAKTPSRTALLQRLGEEALALFHSGALPVPAKLRDTVTALEAVRTGAASPIPVGEWVSTSGVTFEATGRSIVPTEGTSHA